MSPTDVSKVKRVESKNKTDNHNAAKRAKRVEEKKKKKYERLCRMTTEYMYEQDRLLEEAKRQKELEAVEAKEALKLARKKRRLFMQQQRRHADPSILAKSHAKRLKGIEKKEAEEQKRMDAEAQEKLEKQRAKFKRCRDKAKMDDHEKSVFTLTNTTTIRHIQLAAAAMTNIIDATTLDYDHAHGGHRYAVCSMNILRYGVIDALFTCLRRFPNIDWLFFHSLDLLNCLLRAVHSTTTMPSEDDLNTLRSAHLQLSALNACDFIVQEMEKYSNNHKASRVCRSLALVCLSYYNILLSLY